MRLYALVFLFILLAGGISLADTEKPLVEGIGERVEVSFPQAPLAALGPFYWSTTFTKPTASFLRLHFASINNNSRSEFQIVLRDRNGRTVHTYSKSDLTASEFWSRMIRGDTARVEVTGPTAPSGLNFQIDGVSFQKRHAAKYSLVHNPPELEEIIQYKDVPQIFGPSRAVAKLVFSDNGATYSCSGFLLNEENFLTNEHCIDRKETCVGNAVAIFGYELTDSGLSEGEQFDCVEVLGRPNHDLDFSLVKLSSKPGTKYGWLELTRRNVEEGEQSYLIQHPNGEPKQIARKQCSVSTLHAEAIKPDTDLGHQCDTIMGASGSPLLGRDFKVIGLHHLGFSSTGHWKSENRAVQITKVLDQLNIP
jgi:V8-like Glu-specific endopeptidase